MHKQKPNILFIMTDQQRYDSIRRVQNELSAYKGKLKIRTPNLDRLSREGAYVRTAYTQCPVCGPARTSLRTGCTIERTGVQTNPLDDEVNRRNSKLFQDKIDQIEGLDQILVEDHGYVAEYYGKWHIPSRLYHHRDGSSLVVQSNDFDYSRGTFSFKDEPWERKLARYLEHFHKIGDINKTFAPGQQEDSYSKYPYTPITLDSRYGQPTNTPQDVLDSFRGSESSQMGNVTSGKEFSASFLNHDVALRALNRLATQAAPFLLTISYHHPHPPYMASFEYLSYYWDRRQDLFTAPSVGYEFNKLNPYFTSRDQHRLEDAGYCEADNIREWTAVYYAMVEEIDTFIGIILDRLDELGIANNTLVVFTSDHGEMLGAHCRRGKNNFYEESVRVPLFMKLPGVIPAETVVEEPVSLIDVFGTILDYAGASESNKGDGFSFRSFIEGTSHNYLFDETAVVSEWDFREPIDNASLARTLDDRPNFMIRHGRFKLLMHKKARSKKADMLFDLADDPFEMYNLLGIGGPEPDDATVGKAEHLRFLLLDWMTRMQNVANNDFYSDPIYNANEGKGDMKEILYRQSWRATDMWVSDPLINFRKVVHIDSRYIRNEWLYLGRRSPGSLTCAFQVLGRDAGLFHLHTKFATVTKFDAFRLKVTLEYNATAQLPESVDAFIQIKPDVGDAMKVLLLVQMESAVISLSREGHHIPVETGSPPSATRHLSYWPHITVFFLCALSILACAWRREKVTYTLLQQNPV